MNENTFSHFFVFLLNHLPLQFQYPRAISDCFSLACNTFYETLGAGGHCINLELKPCVLFPQINWYFDGKNLWCEYEHITHTSTHELSDFHIKIIFTRGCRNEKLGEFNLKRFTEHVLLSFLYFCSHKLVKLAILLHYCWFIVDNLAEVKRAVPLFFFLKH